MDSCEGRMSNAIALRFLASAGNSVCSILTAMQEVKHSAR